MTIEWQSNRPIGRSVVACVLWTREGRGRGDNVRVPEADGPARIVLERPLHILTASKPAR